MEVAKLDRKRNAAARRRVLAAAALALVAAAAVLALYIWQRPGGPPLTQGAPVAGTPICGQPMLDSPWSYDGAPGTYSTNGTPAGLPTFGSAGTDFPSATRVMVVPAGDNTSAADSGTYQVAHTVVYFEPGAHVIQNVMYTGHDSAYVGGYNAAAGKAVINGVNGATTNGVGGNYLSSSTPSSGTNVNDTWEYLTIENFASSENASVMGNINGGGWDSGDSYKYDTIGPNEYGWAGDSKPPRTGESNGGGYAIDLGNNTTIEYDCLARNAQGAFNGSQAANVKISKNEISWNGLGEYPDSGGSGASPFACGCSGGGKLFFTVNADVTNNYIHDNYNTGIWFDFDNTGADISGNYIASNWGFGIEYEASYNANISDNTLVGNGWASDGPWPSGVGGGSCYNGISCTNGVGPVSGSGGGFPYAAIYLPNSGGNENLNVIANPGCSLNCTLTSNYRGKLLVDDNNFRDNFGGVMVYTDTNRYPGNIDGDSSCSPPLGAMGERNSTKYYQQDEVLETHADGAISGSQVTTTGGTFTLCSDYGNSIAPGGSDSSEVHAASVGMAVYDLDSGAFLGTVAGVTSPRTFTLSRSAGHKTGATLLLSAYGGCGPADYYGGRLGVKSGRPLADYWDNCIWGSRNVIVSGNSFSMDAGKVTDCTIADLCGYQAAIAFNAGVPPLMGFWNSYQAYIGDASGGLGDVWSDNTYSWSGGGPGQWQFQAGQQGRRVTRAQWQAAPYRQDAGSVFTQRAQ